MMKKQLMGIILLIFILTLSACSRQLEEAKAIGVITPLTGDVASWGQAVKKGIDLAAQERGIGDSVIFEDSKCDLQEGFRAAKKLIEVEDTDVILGTVCSSVTLGVAPLTEENDVLLVSTGSSSPAVTDAGDYVFRMWPSDTYEATVITDYISNNMVDIESMAILQINNDYGEHLAQALKKNADEKGIEITATEKFSQDETDFRSHLLKLKQKNPDAIYIVTNSEETVPIMNQYSELNIGSQVFLPGWIVEDETIFEKIGPQLEGVIYAVADMAANDAFTKRLKDTYGEENQYPLVSALAYDSANIVFDAGEKCGWDTACMRDFMYTMPVRDGAAGKTRFDENGDVLEKDFLIKKVENGEFKEIKK